LRYWVFPCLIFGLVFCTEFARNHSDNSTNNISWLNSEFIAWNQTANYDHNGFLIGFAYNLGKFQLSAPDGYSEQVIQEIATEYNNKKADDASRTILSTSDYNIVVVLNESFYDPELLKDYYKGKTAIRISLNKYNVNEYKELIKIAEEYNIDLIRFTPIISFGRAKNEDLTINQDQYIDFLNNIKKAKSKVEIIYPNKPNPQKIWIGTNGFGCHCGKEAIWIDEVGNYSPCIFWGDKYILGNIREKSYMDLWKESLITANIKGNKTCENCKNYKVCRGGCRVRALYED